MQIDETLKQRGAQYGDFLMDARICQDIKRVVTSMEGWHRLADDQKQALELIIVKIARILNGNPDYKDNWWDIMGYARLVHQRLEGGVLVLPSLDGLPALLQKSDSPSTQLSGQ